MMNQAHHDLGKTLFFYSEKKVVLIGNKRDKKKSTQREKD
jgi:hypothetical protein